MMKTGRLYEAEEIVKALLREYPDSVENLMTLADIAWEQGELSNAENILKRAQSIAPRSLPVGSRLNRIYWRRGEVQKVLGVVKSMKPSCYQLFTLCFESALHSNNF
jgi:predicted Zn-dependent protease